MINAEDVEQHLSYDPLTGEHQTINSIRPSIRAIQTSLPTTRKKPGSGRAVGLLCRQ